ncbi:hypothetical protein DPMN_187518 [Dreissena polymorpha]|uniref:Uncharacterized protein n=1 Tax=Dreissena polymorpha TaxID=45954 RepID=A0A9D4IAI0_DREPO|nr:hypothetical protein DPMN_187518 [Dreissena polymorpha]
MELVSIREDVLSVTESRQYIMMGLVEPCRNFPSLCIRGLGGQGSISSFSLKKVDILWRQFSSLSSGMPLIKRLFLRHLASRSIDLYSADHGQTVLFP